MTSPFLWVLKAAGDMQLFQNDIHTVASTVHDIGLRLNASKSKLVVMSRKQNPPNLMLSVYNSLLQQVKSVSYLGVQIMLAIIGPLLGSPIDALCSKAKK